MIVCVGAGSPVRAQSRGEAEVALQGYYQGGNAGAPENLSGLAVSFRDFLPHLGLLSGNLEGYNHQGSFEPGDNFLQLKGGSWLGRRWTVTGGDFRAQANLFEIPFSNLYYPDLSARGFRLEAADKDTQYTLFLGQETLLSGPRVPFRLAAPQSVAGATARRTMGKLQFGVRMMRLWTSPESMAENITLFAANQQFLTTNTATLQAMYSSGALRLYGEVGGSRSTELGKTRPSTGTSELTGFSWDTPALTIRANYASLGPAYLPVVGYYAGDRRGPFGEIRYRPWKPVELFASGSRYENNLSNNTELQKIRTASSSFGAAALLPYRFSTSGQVSFIGIVAPGSAGEPESNSSNRQITGNLVRPIGRHTARLTFRDLKLQWLGQNNRQRSLEAEDAFSYKRLTLAAAIRDQQATGPERRTSLYGRGSAQLRLGRFGVHGYFEGGKDLVNQTVFAVQTLKTTTAGVSVAVTRSWNFTADAYRYTLAQDLNLENQFILGGRGIGVSTVLAGLNTWNVYFRLSKNFHWGAPFEPGGLDRYVLQQIRLAGSVEGFVHAALLDGTRPAPGVPVSLDDSRVVQTDADGRYRFADVPEGAHKVAIAAAELAPEFDPGPPASATAVEPRRVTRVDLSVLPLTRLTGQVTSPTPGVNLENVTVRLLPTGRYTTPSPDGVFAFENLREGNYEVELDTSTLPEHAVVVSPTRVAAVVRCSTPPSPIQFRLEIREAQKPIRRVFTSQ